MKWDGQVRVTHLIIIVDSHQTLAMFVHTEKTNQNDGFLEK